MTALIVFGILFLLVEPEMPFALLLLAIFVVREAFSAKGASK